MNTISRKPPIRAKHYLKKTNYQAIPTNFGIEEATPELNLNSISSATLTTFDGFFEDKPKFPSLTYELCNAYALKFLDTSQYLWGTASSASITKSIQEILEAFENLVDNQESIVNFEHKKKILQQANQALYLELENRETIQHKMLLGNLMSSAE